MAQAPAQPVQMATQMKKIKLMLMIGGLFVAVRFSPENRTRRFKFDVPLGLV